MLWRRSYDTPPPRIDDADEWSQIGDPRYADLPDEIVPRTECLADVVERMLPYWYDAIVPDLRAGQTVCVAAHGNSLRGLVAHLDHMTKEAVVSLNIPTGIPLVYSLDADLSPREKGGAYLDPDAAASAIQAVAGQGR
jgi:2,3-bisphosphoglycerate-dependent phosphoglycerate mutase